jgi:hypothetical protein
MEFTVDVKEFSNTIKLISSVVATGGSAFSSTLVLSEKDSILWIYANNDVVTLKCAARGIESVKGKGRAGIDLTVLDKALKGRTKIVFTNEGTEFTFKAKVGEYGGKISILPVIAETIKGYNDSLKPDEDSKSTTLSPTTFSLLSESLSLTGISAIHSSDSVDTYITLDKKVLEVVSSDQFHLAYSKVNCKTKTSFQLSPSKTAFDILSKLSDVYGGDTQVQLSGEFIKAINDNYSIITSTIQSSDTAFVRAKSFIGDLPDPLCYFDLEVAKIQAVLDNILSVYEDGALISLNLGSDPSKKDRSSRLLEFSMKSNVGSVSDTLKVKDVTGKDFKCKFNPKMLVDSLALSKCTKTSFEYIDGKAMVFKCKKGETEIIYVNSVVN